LWIAGGIRVLDRDVEFGVVDGPIPGMFPLLTNRRIVLAPPGLTRLSRYPRGQVELELPSAIEAGLPGSDGSRYGLRGSAALSIRPESWRETHAAAQGAGLRGLLLAALVDSEVPLPTRWERDGALAPPVERAFRGRLAAELERRGVELVRLDLEGVDPWTVEREEDFPDPAPTRLLIVGLDGADWEIIDPLIERGRMPNLAKLIRNGSRARLLTISPMLSPVVWTTVATGVEPARHGILDFLEPDPGGGGAMPVTSAQRKTPTVWQILSRAGVRVGVVGWWASWPAEPVDGYLVSDRIAYQLFGYEPDAENSEGKVWPPELYPVVKGEIVEPGAIEWNEVAPYLEGARSLPGQFSTTEREILDEFRTLLASGQTYLRVARALSGTRPPDLEALYFEGTDTVGHLFMRFRAPRLPGVPSESFESFQSVVDRYYETVDGYLGTILEGRGDDWTVMVLSDHGFVSDQSRPHTTDPRIGHGAAADWHRRFGMLVLSGRNIRAGIQIDEATVYDVGPTILALFGQPIPISWPGVTLAEVLEPGFLEAHPVRYRRDDPPLSDWRDAQATVTTDPVALAVLEKLETLGYLGGSTQEGSLSIGNHNNAGVALMAEGKYAEAESEFRAALQVAPKHSAVLVNLALVLRLQGRTEEAASVLRSALEFPEVFYAAGLNLAEIAYESGDLEGAEHQLREILRREPDSADARTTLGLVLEARGDRGGAEAEYRRAAELDRSSASARNSLGNLAKRRGMLDEAERWYREAIEVDPYFMGAYNNLALVFQERGDVENAVELYEQARRRAPGNAIVLNNLASLHYAAGRLDEAAELWQQALRFAPSYPSPLNNLAGIAIAEGRLDDAEQLLHEALERDPGYGDARINLALVYRRRERRVEARVELDRAAHDPAARVGAWLELGTMDLEDGEPASAVERIELALAERPSDPRALNLLGEAYRRLGRTADAAAAWRRSLAIDPSQNEIERGLAQLGPA
jgi:Flp pilus assembly protein TadD/predicted AlkP superfamily phosphohydrolase/phosphomutase